MIWFAVCTSFAYLRTYYTTICLELGSFTLPLIHKSAFLKWNCGCYFRGSTETKWRRAFHCDWHVTRFQRALQSSVPLCSWHLPFVNGNYDYVYLRFVKSWKLVTYSAWGFYTAWTWKEIHVWSQFFFVLQANSTENISRINKTIIHFFFAFPWKLFM